MVFKVIIGMWCYAGAIITANFLSALPAIWFSWLLIVLVFLSFLFSKNISVFSVIKPVLLGIALGLLCIQFAAKQMFESRLPEDLEGKDLRIEGAIVDLPAFSKARGHDKANFEFIVKKAIYSSDHENKVIPLEKVRLSWFKPPQKIKAGQQWSFTVRLKRPRGFSNPEAFDYERWLVGKGVDATGYVRKQPLAVLHQQSLNIDVVRENISSKLIQSSLERWGSLFPALVVADKRYITHEQWQKVSEWGLNHLLAISGLHIGLMALLGAGVGRILSRLFWIVTFKRVCFLRLTPVCAFVFAFVYSALAGFSIPTMRALLAVSIVCLALICRRTINLHLIFVTVLSSVLTMDPLSALDMGFWLSFSAVGVLLWQFSGRKIINRNSTETVFLGHFQRQEIDKDNPQFYSNLLINFTNRFKQWFIQLSFAQWVLAIGLLIPLSMTVGQFSWHAPIANLIAVPVVTIVIIPMVLFSTGLIVLGEEVGITVMAMASTILDFVFSAIENFLVYLPVGLLPLPGLPLAMCMLAFIGFLLFFLPRLMGSWWLASVLIAPVIIVFLTSFKPNNKQDAQLTLLDVGQGTALVFEAGNRVLVYDVGPKYSEKFDAGRDIVAKYLWKQNYSHVDTLVISHGDYDHRGGVEGFLSRYKAKELITSAPEKLPQIERVDVSLCREGMKQNWGSGITVKVLWPDNLGGSRNSNNQSCVVFIEANGKKVLLLGDIEASVERHLVVTDLLPKEVDIVLVPHHGSKTSSSTELLSHIKAKYGLISRGYKNRHGHPHYSVVKRYRGHGVELLDTVEQGAIQVRWDDTGKLKIYTSRSLYQQWWRS